MILKCQDNLAFLSKTNNKFDLIVTSPPYNIGKGYESNQPFQDYLSQVKKVIVACDKVLSESGAIVWQVGNTVTKGAIIPLDVYFLPMFFELGYQLRNRLVLTSEFGLHCTNRLSGRYEVALWLTKSDNYTFNLDPIRIPQKYPNKKAYRGPNVGELSGNPLGKNPGDVWPIIPIRSNHPEKTEHPCAFPLDWCFKVVKAFSNSGNKVFDPYCGVGSIPLAAEALGRKGYGRDREQRYIDIAKDRANQLLNGTLKARIDGETILLGV